MSTYSFDKYLLYTYYMPRTLPVMEHIADSNVENSQIFHVFRKLIFR